MALEYFEKFRVALESEVKISGISIFCKSWKSNDTYKNKKGKKKKWKQIILFLR